MQLKIIPSPSNAINARYLPPQTARPVNERDAVSRRALVAVSAAGKLCLFSLVSLFSDADTAEKGRALYSKAKLL